MRFADDMTSKDCYLKAMESNVILFAKSYQEVLNIEFKKRMLKNSNYSLRSFAQRLKIPASGLSEILNGKRGLSRARAESIAKSLEMTPLESEYFTALVESVHARAKRIRSLAEIKAHQCREIYENPLSADHLKVISEWWHLAILELTRTRAFKSCPLWISKKLGLSVTTTREAVRRLLRLRILKKSGERLRPTGDWLLVSSQDVPSEVIRKFHKDLIQKAYDAVEKQDVMKRNLSSLVFAIDTSDEKHLQQMKKMIMDFNRKLNKFATTTGLQTQLYSFTTQLFSLEEPE